jgi:hypothetical protein
MKTLFNLAISALGASLLGVAPVLSADEHHRPAHAAELALVEIHADALAEQYRHLLMETFKARLESKLKHLEHELRGATDLDPDTARRMLALSEARIELLEETTERVRVQFIELHLDLARAAAEAEEHEAEEDEHAEADEDEVVELSGRWVGRELASDTRIVMEIEGADVRLEMAENNIWYEGEFEVGGASGDLREVDFHIRKCTAPQYNGKVSRGIARFERDRFVLAANEPGVASRPTGLEPAGETRVFVLERD